MNRSSICMSITTALMVFGLVSGAMAAEKKSLCVYDPGGANGDVFNMMKDFKLKALGLGVDFKLKPYTDEKTAADDFKAGQCDAALITGTRLRPLHKFGGTVEAMGALPTYKHLGKVIKTLSKKGASKLMKSGEYENGGIFVGGAVYLFVADRKVNTVKALAGKRLATMAFDDAAKTMVRKVGASLAAADIGTFAGMFNNGSVDACYAPAFAYKALELYKGLKKGGGVIRYPLAQMTMQLIMRTKNFPAGFGAGTRALAYKSFKRGVATAKKAEKTIAKKHWIDIPDDDKARYDEMFLDVRVSLRDGKKKVYHPKALKLLRKVRCKADPSRAECVEKRE